MKLEGVTINDIAKALNTSKSTVSRAFKDAPDVSIKTKKLVLEYARKISFSPNRIASGLKHGKSHSVGLVVSEIASPFFSQVLNGIESAAYKKNYNVIIAQSFASPEKEIKIVQQLCSHSIDGLLISLSDNTADVSHLKKWQAKGLPIVFFDKVTDKIKTHRVEMDNQFGAFKATQHLINEDFKNIAHFAPPSSLSITQQRLAGYKEALKKNGIPFNKALVKYFDQETDLENKMEAAIGSLLESKSKPDAILASSDKITSTCYLVLKKIVQEKPIGLAGFTNNELYSFLTPPVTVVQQPTFEIGKIAMELLIQLIESKEPVRKFEKKILQSVLLVRESSKIGVI